MCVYCLNVLFAVEGEIDVDSEERERSMVESGGKRKSDAALEKSTVSGRSADKSLTSVRERTANTSERGPNRVRERTQFPLLIKGHNA